jgi:hypothetical protein
VKLRRHLSWFESQREPEAATEPSE